MDFHRQKPIDVFILDFFCPELNFGIEVDGYSHQFSNVKRRDIIKEKRLNELGITVLRFTDEQVFEELDRVVGTIKDFIEKCK